MGRDLIQIIGENREVPSDWMPATGIRSLMQGDPCMLWLEFHGKSYGFTKDVEEFSFLSFLGELGRRFEESWAMHGCPEAPRIIEHDWDVKRVEGVKELANALQARIPIIWKCPMWNAPAKIYGTADFLALRSWIEEKFPGLLSPSSGPDHYLPVELKFTSKLDSAEKRADLAIYRNQLRLYGFMLGAMQGLMPQNGLIFTRDRLDNPHVIDLSLDSDDLPIDLAQLRDSYLDIKMNGSGYTPWEHEVVAPLLGGDSAPWNEAKKIIATEKTEGGALEQLHLISPPRAKVLRQGGVRSLQQLINEPQHWAGLRELSGLGNVGHAQIMALLQANHTGKATQIPSERVPSAEVEIYVDYEYFSSINVDFHADWPALSGTEMIFAIGCGWEEEGEWRYKRFFADAETHQEEARMFEKFLEFLESKSVFSSKAALYHWTSAEVWQSSKAAERIGDERISTLPWVDLCNVFTKTPIGIPGGFEFGLKKVAKALSSYAPEFAVEWPEGLGDGLSAQVMSWAAYATNDPKKTKELILVDKYLEIDVKATWMIHRWLRASATLA